jgi:omega-6 fatty acid desaturase (delta-12 desaturase)
LSEGNADAPRETKVVAKRPTPLQKPDPENLSDVLKILPRDAMEQRLGFALFTAVRVWVTVFIALYLTINSPWYLLPFAWVFLGTAATGLFVVGHDCAHQSFSRDRRLNEIVGTICMSPLLFPYNGWEVTHNKHHAHANNLDRDHLWKPLRKEELAKMSAFQKYLAYYMYGPVFFESSIIHHAYHFLLPFKTSKGRQGVIRSIAFCLLIGGATLYTLSLYGSVFKLYIVPFLVFEFWLSTFTYFHHRNPRGAGWKEEDDWTKVYGSLYATVHVGFPSWVEFLTLDINWHLPHHVSALIPWYNLRRCTHSLLMAYGDRLSTDEFSWELWKETTTSCHVYDKNKGYASMFD